MDSTDMPKATCEELGHVWNDGVCKRCGEPRTTRNSVSAKERQFQRENEMITELFDRLAQERERWQHVPEKEIKAISLSLQTAIDRVGRSWERAAEAVEQAANAWERKASDL